MQVQRRKFYKNIHFDSYSSRTGTASLVILWRQGEGIYLPEIRQKSRCVWKNIIIVTKWKKAKMRENDN